MPRGSRFIIAVLVGLFMVLALPPLPGVRADDPQMRKWVNEMNEAFARGDMATGKALAEKISARARKIMSQAPPGAFQTGMPTGWMDQGPGKPLIRSTVLSCEVFVRHSFSTRIDNATGGHPYPCGQFTYPEIQHSVTYSARLKGELRYLEYGRRHKGRVRATGPPQLQNLTTPPSQQLGFTSGAGPPTGHSGGAQPAPALIIRRGRPSGHWGDPRPLPREITIERATGFIQEPADNRCQLKRYPLTIKAVAQPNIIAVLHITPMGDTDAQVFYHPPDFLAYGPGRFATQPQMWSSSTLAHMGPGQLKVSQKELFDALLKGRSWSREIGWDETPRGIHVQKNHLKIVIKPPLEPGVLAVTPAKGIMAEIDDSKITPPYQAYTLRNTGQEPLDFQVKIKKPWLVLSQTKGALAPGASATVQVTLEKPQGKPEKCTYQDQVVFTNTTNHKGDTRREVEMTPVEEWEVYLSGTELDAMDSYDTMRTRGYRRNYRYFFTLAGSFRIKKIKTKKCPWVFDRGRIHLAKVRHVPEYLPPEFATITRDNCYGCPKVTNLKGAPLRGNVEGREVKLNWGLFRPYSRVTTRLTADACKRFPKMCNHDYHFEHVAPDFYHLIRDPRLPLKDGFDKFYHLTGQRYWNGKFAGHHTRARFTYRLKRKK